jgi:hypothetical protein
VSKSDRWSPTLRVWIALSLILIAQANAAAERHSPKKIRNIIEQLRKQLLIDEEIEVVLVAKNDLLVSVQPDRPRGVFRMFFERAFLNTLTDEDLNAVIAHELGHVYIFTHHPYLQTEEGANNIAYKAVTIEAMERVYEKVRSRTRVPSNLSASVH